MILTVLIYLLLLPTITLALLYILLPIGVCVYLKLKLEPVKGICKSNARLDNKIVLVTGGNQGIGLETARDLASRGARVIIACRDGQKSAEAIADIARTTGSNNVEYRYLDLSKFSSVRKFAEDFNNTYDRLDILINNAGVGGLKHKASEDGIDMVMQVNYLGPFLLTNLLLDKIKASPAGRIIILSSFLHLCARLTPDQLNGLHTKYHIMKYSNSKLCEVLWMKALTKRLPKNVTVNALHPGVVKTDIFRRARPLHLKWLMFLLDVFNFKTPKEGAQTSIYLAVSEDVANVSGKYYMECKEAAYSRTADNEEMVEEIWNKSIMLTS